MESELKKRNGCISFWLWFAIFVNIGLSIFYAVTMFSAYMGGSALGLGLCSILAAFNILSAILLLRWNKVGFYMMIVSSLMAIIVNICILKMEPVAILSSLVAIVIWWAILQMKRDGVSAWSQLQSGWDVKHCRHLYQFFGILGVILFVLTMVAYVKVSNDLDNDYFENDTVEVADDEVMSDVEVEEVLTTVDSATEVKEDVIVEDLEKPIIRREKHTTNRQNVSDDASASSSKTKDPNDFDKHVRFLKDAIKEGNKSFPQKATEGMVIKRCYLDGDYLMYLAECDEDLYDIDLLNINKSDMKQGIKDMVRQKNDPQISYLVKLCIKAHKGIGFKYQGDTTGKSCIVKVPYYELENL